MKNVRPVMLMTVIVAAAASRLIPHPPNFTPIAAIALFAGAYSRSVWQAFVIPLGAMVVSDLLIGWHPLVPVVYASFALIVGIGMWLRGRKTVSRIALAVGASSLMFFLITNFAVWAFGPMYPKSLEGLLGAYIAGIPFFRNTVLGDACYSVILFGGFALLERYTAALREPAPPVGSYS
jgi:hypothetical protein